MTVNETYEAIAKHMPPIIYVSGKTSTGKSTFGRRLRDELGYTVIELEAILLNIIKSQGYDEQQTFRKVFYEPGDFDEKALFLKETDRIISEALSGGQPTVIEGAVANVDTLKRILTPATGLQFLYFHPASIDLYTRYLTNRFMQSSEDSYGGLPLKFWQLIDDDEFKTFCRTRKLSSALEDSISQYALSSQKESSERLEKFRQNFPNITVVEVA